MGEPAERDLARRLLRSGLLDPGELRADTAWRIGRYEVRGPLGRGATSEVFLARDPLLDRLVALKLLGPEVPPVRFEREMKLLAALDHPAIVRVLDAGLHDDRPYVVMDYVGERTLDGADLPLEEVVAALERAARACHYAHERGIVHRDLKPANVLLGPEGAVVADFGVAKLLDPSKDLTAPGALVGTPAYMAPEQLRGEAIGPWTDVYALGVMLYEALCGRLPHSGDGPLALLGGALGDDPPRPPRDFRPELPPALERVALRALAKRPAERHESALEFAQALRAWRRGTPSGGETDAPRSAGEGRPSRTAWVACAVLALLAAGGVWLRGRATAQRAPALPAASPRDAAQGTSPSARAPAERPPRSASARARGSTSAPLPSRPAFSESPEPAPSRPAPSGFSETAPQDPTDGERRPPAGEASTPGEAAARSPTNSSAALPGEASDPPPGPPAQAGGIEPSPGAARPDSSGPADDAPGPGPAAPSAEALRAEALRHLKTARVPADFLAALRLAADAVYAAPEDRIACHLLGKCCRVLVHHLFVDALDANALRELGRLLPRVESIARPRAAAHSQRRRAWGDALTLRAALDPRHDLSAATAVLGPLAKSQPEDGEVWVSLATLGLVALRAKPSGTPELWATTRRAVSLAEARIRPRPDPEVTVLREQLALLEKARGDSKEPRRK
ncbi:MAG: serine/threonine protein kinase [Planctomycetota bacterium]|nr:MAG: serine/threonine protein kinase [Planctomycetota bacterium]